MYKAIMSLFLFSSVIILSCKKEINDNPADYQLERVDYYDSNGLSTPYFKKLTYAGGLLTRIETISNNWSILKYQQTQLTSLDNMLLGVPVPISNIRLRYSANGQLEQILKSGSGLFQPSPVDTLTFTWIGNKLVKANLIALTLAGALHAKEELKYSYHGDNITKCVFEGSYHAYTAGPVYWKDSLELQYDTAPKYFGEFSTSFFWDEFLFINAFHKNIFRVLDWHLAYQQFDPAFFAVVQSKNNIINIKANGGSKSLSYSYITGTGVLQDKLTEMRINNKLVSKYTYKKIQ